MNSSRIMPFWFFVLSIVFGLTLPVLIQDGMFQDGVLYSCVSHNMSQGIGSFWFPQYSTLNIAELPSFHEQPPLVFGIQSLFFKLLGSSIYVERFYTFLMLCINILLIVFLWRSIFKNDDSIKKLSFLPVLFWILFPVCFWSYSNNMIENTMSIFTLASVLLMFRIYSSEKKQIFKWVITGILIFLATFSKGIPGFFPVTFPLLYYITIKKNRFAECIYQTAIITLIPLLIYTILFNLPHSGESLSNYFFKRVLFRIDVMPTADYRMEILWRLFTESIPSLLLIAIILLYVKLKKIPFSLTDKTKHAVLFILIGLMSALPLSFTMVQKGFYLVPSFPFFATGLAILISPVIMSIIETINTSGISFRILKYTTVALFAGTIIFTIMQKGKISREKDMIRDIYKIGTIVPEHTTITVPVEMYNEYDFVLQGFLVRYFNISIAPNTYYDFYLKEKLLNVPVPAGYIKINMTTEKYDLYKKAYVPLS